MKINKALAVAVLVSVGMAGQVLAGVSASTGVMMKRAVMTSASEIKWEPYAPGSPLQISVLWGDRTKGEYGMYLKMPAGFEAGFHSHTLDYQALAMQGKWVHTDDLGNAKELGAMSYVWQAGKSNHNDVCKGPEDCIIFIFQKGPGDFIPVPAKKP